MRKVVKESSLKETMMNDITNNAVYKQAKAICSKYKYLMPFDFYLYKSNGNYCLRCSMTSTIDFTPTIFIKYDEGSKARFELSFMDVDGEQFTVNRFDSFIKNCANTRLLCNELSKLDFSNLYKTS